MIELGITGISDILVLNGECIEMRKLVHWYHFSFGQLLRFPLVFKGQFVEVKELHGSLQSFLSWAAIELPTGIKGTVKQSRLQQFLSCSAIGTPTGMKGIV